MMIFYIGTKIMHKKTNIDADEDSIVHLMVYVVPDLTPDLSLAYTPNIPASMLMSAPTLKK